MSTSFTAMLNNFLATHGTNKDKGKGRFPNYQPLPSSDFHVNRLGIGEEQVLGSPLSLTDHASLTTTNSAAALPGSINPHVLNFSRIVDFFYANENDRRDRDTTKNRDLIQVEVETLYPSAGEPSKFKEPATAQIQIIDWHMLDKWKFYPLSMLSSFTIRCCLYPFTVVKTCIQMQQRNTVYTSMFDAYRKIYASEGMGGLYKGFWVSTFQIVSGVGYVSTYEGVRHLLKTNSIIDNNNVRALIAGGCASMVGQTFLVPFDVISQHLMVLGKTTGSQSLVLNPLNISYENRTKFQITRDITKEIYRRDGMRGYYRGYMASLGTYVPNSALWWSFYHIYQGELAKYVPANTSHLLVQCFAAILGGFTTTILTNPLDVCRARLQVQRLDSFPQTFTILWREERLAIFTKGLSARLTQSAVFSFAIILGYETIKRFSVKENYKDQVTW